MKCRFVEVVVVVVVRREQIFWVKKWRDNDENFHGYKINFDGKFIIADDKLNNFDYQLMNFQFIFNL